MDALITNLMFAFWIFLPAGVANMSPVIAGYLPGLKRWNTPIDLGKEYKGHRLLGDNKRWRGLVFGTAMGALTAIVEFLIISRYLVNFRTAVLVAVAGALMGFGALFGDALESFFKRRLGVKPGNRWFPFDQIDYIIGGLLFSYPIIGWPVVLAGTILLLYFGLHILVSYTAYLIGLKEKPI